MERYDTEIMKKVSANLTNCKDGILSEIEKIRSELATLSAGYEGESSEFFMARLREYNANFDLFAQDGENFSNFIKAFATTLEEIEVALKKKYEEIG